MIITILRGEASLLRGFGLFLIAALFYVEPTFACSACLRGSSRAPCEMQVLAESVRTEHARQVQRDYGSGAWWREQYPSVDDHTLENLVAFHDIMVELGGLGDRRREKVAFVQQAYATSGPEADHRSPTAHAYRQAVMDLERALESHPALEPYDEQLEALRAERREVASGQAEVLQGWHDARRMRFALYNEAVQKAMSEYQEGVAALRERAGVGPRESLPAAYESEHAALVEARAEALQFARDTMERVSDPDYIEQSRADDGSQAIFDAANARHAEIQESEETVEESRLAARVRLRETDPELLRLAAKRDAASRKHLEAMSEREDVQEAQAFIDGFDEYRDELQHKARLLRRDILDLYPDKEPILRELANVAGLGRVPEHFWSLSQ